ncbi:MAG: hypothetical protein IT453_05850 [Planctomycetes bacterium]|nr:hypothetical protein [Planctomycetota bacterium]
MFSRFHPGADPRSVLFLSSSQAEWFELVPVGEPLYGRVAVGGSSADEMARAALDARRAAGSTTPHCVLALGPGVVTQRHMTLPEVSSKELRVVLARRAAQLIDSPEIDALYAGFPGAREVKTPGQEAHAECHWTLLALRRSFARELAGRLDHNGIRASRIVAARIAVLSHVDRVLGAVQGATLVIDFEPSGTVVSLLDGGRFLHQTSLDGDVAEQPGMALAIVQEARSFESNWRRESRGAPLGRVCLIGLARERAELFRNALANALPGVEAVLLPKDGGGVAAGRLATLEACLSRGRFDLDLTVPLPWPVSRRVALAASAIAIVGSMGVVAEGRVADERANLEAETRVLLESTRDLEELERSNAEVAARRAELGSEVERLVELERRGLELGRVLEDAFAAFDGAADLLAVRIASDAPRAVLVGETHPHPLRALAAISDVRRALAATASFGAPTVDAPSSLPSKEDVARALPLEFTVSASLEGGR